MNPLALLIGPLFVPECKRSARRGWSLVIRSGTGLLLGLPFLVALWWWWLQTELEPGFRSNQIVTIGLGVTVGFSMLLALILAPAILAGTLAGERERGSIGLLLSTRVDAREIVLGRLLGKLSIVAGMLLAGWPFVIGFASLGDVGVAETLSLLLLPMAVGFGVGGISIAASSVAKKGWSALMAIYFVEVMLLLLPLIKLLPGTGSIDWLLEVFNPFAAIPSAAMSQSALPALATIANWMIVGSLGVAFASWRLRPSFLASTAGKAHGNSRGWKVPPLQDKPPMLWKELYIERGAALGWFGRILGMVLFLYLVGGSLTLVGFLLWQMFSPGEPTRMDQLVVLCGRLYTDPGSSFAFLIQMAIGLRAAVAVSSERERETWDALLTSPLTGREIVLGKLWGSLFRLRWLLFAVLFSWVVSVSCGAMSLGEFGSLIVQTVLFSTYAAAIGVRMSLSAATATKSMTMTVGAIMVTLIVASIVMVISTATIMLLFLMVWMILSPLGLVSQSARLFVPIGYFGAIWSAQMVAAYLSFTLMIVSETWRKFDTLSGRSFIEERRYAKAVRVETPDAIEGQATDPPDLIREVERVGS